LIIFGVSVWNGGGYYIEVFGRKYVSSTFHTTCCSLIFRFERELESLRKELAEATARSSGTVTPSEISRDPSQTDLAALITPALTDSGSSDSGSSLDVLTEEELKKDV